MSNYSNQYQRELDIRATKELEERLYRRFGMEYQKLSESTFQARESVQRFESEPPEAGMWTSVKDFFKEMPLQLAAGGFDAVNNTLNFVRDIGQAIGLPNEEELKKFEGKFLFGKELEEKPGFKIPELPPAKTAAGGFVRALSTFALGFAPARAGLGALKVGGALGKSLAAGAIADAVVMDPHQVRLATLLNEIPALGLVVPDYLADNNPENESVWEGRLKNTIDGLGAGLLTEGVIQGTIKLLKGYKVFRKAKETELVAKPESPETITKDLDKTVDARLKAEEELISAVSIKDIVGKAKKIVEKKSDIVPKEQLPPARQQTINYLEKEILTRSQTLAIKHARRAEREVLKFQTAAANLDEGVFKNLEPLISTLKKLKLSQEKKQIAYIQRLTTQLKNEYAPQKKVYINTRRIETTEDIHNAIQVLADEQADLLKQGRKTHAGIKKEAKQAFKDIKEMLGREVTRPFTPEEVIASREFLHTAAKDIIPLAKKVRDINLCTKTDEFVFNRALATYNVIQQVSLWGRRAAGQVLNSYKIPVGTDKARGEAIAAISAGKSKTTFEKAAHIVELDEKEKGFAAISRAVWNFMTDGRWADSFYQMRVNGLLSGLGTHAVNALSNAVSVGMAIPEKYMTVGFEKLTSAGGGKLLEANAYLSGFGPGCVDGVKLMTGIIKDSQLGLVSKLEHHIKGITSERWGAAPDSFIGRGIDYMGSAIGAPGWALDKVDLLFKGINYRMALHGQAARTAYSENLRGTAFKKRYAELIDNPTDPIQDLAADFALYRTFTTPAGPITKEFQRLVNLIPLGRHIVPFIRVAANLFKFSFDRTPLLPFARAEIRDKWKRGGVERATVLAQMATGSILMGAAIPWVLDGAITGGGPRNYRERRVLEQTGWQPYSIRIGNKYYKYGRLEPYSSFFGFTADITEIINAIGDEESESIPVAGVMAFSRLLGNKSFISGGIQFLDIVASGEPYKINKFAQQQATTLLPYSGALKFTGKYFDDVKRDYMPDDEMSWLKSIIVKAKDTVPGLGKDMPPLRDLWGEELHLPKGIFGAFDHISPITVKKVDPNPVNNMLADNRIPIGLPRRTIGGMKLTNREYSRYSEIAGKKAKEIMDKFYPSIKTLSEGPDGGISLATQRIIENSRKYARSELFKEMPEIKERYKDFRRTQREGLRR